MYAYNIIQGMPHQFIWMFMMLYMGVLRSLVAHVFKHIID